MKKTLIFLFGLSLVFLGGCSFIRQSSGITTPCLPTTAPWIEIIYPNGGEIYNMGQKMIIKWMTCNAQSGQTITLAMGQEDTGNVGAFKPFKSFFPYHTSNDGTEMVKLDASSMSGDWPFSSGNNYKVSAILDPLSTNTEETAQIQDLSNNRFTIR